MKFFYTFLLLIFSCSFVYAAADYVGLCQKLIDKKQRSNAISQCATSAIGLSSANNVKVWNSAQLQAKVGYANVLGNQILANQSFKPPRLWTWLATWFIFPVWYLSGAQLSWLPEKQYRIYHDVYSTNPLEFARLYDKLMQMQKMFRRVPLAVDQDKILRSYIRKTRAFASGMSQCDTWAVVLLENIKPTYEYLANKSRSYSDADEFYNVLFEIRVRQRALQNCIKSVSAPKVVAKPTVKPKPIPLDSKLKITNLDVKSR